VSFVLHAHMFMAPATIMRLAIATAEQFPTFITISSTIANRSSTAARTDLYLVLRRNPVLSAEYATWTAAVLSMFSKLPAKLRRTIVASTPWSVRCFRCACTLSGYCSRTSRELDRLPMLQFAAKADDVALCMQAIVSLLKTRQWAEAKQQGTYWFSDVCVTYGP